MSPYARLSPICRQIVRRLRFTTLIIKTRQGIITIRREILAHGLHMAVRARACDLKGLCQRYEGLTLQRATDDLDQRLGQVREVAQRLVLDGAALAVATS